MHGHPLPRWLALVIVGTDDSQSIVVRSTGAFSKLFGLTRRATGYFSMSPRRLTSPYRNLPAVDALVRAAEARADPGALPQQLFVEAARAVLAAARGAVAEGQPPPALTDLAKDLLRKREEEA